MTEANEPILPEQAQDLLNQIASENHNKGKTKIFVGVSNMGTINVGLWMAMLSWAQNLKEFELWFHFVVEKRHADFARNILADEFLKTQCDYMAMLDADVSPNPNFLSLVNHDKDIVAANTHCWINNELIPSIWQKAPCEQCVNLKKWLEEDKIHDPREYYADKGILYRWEPIRQQFLRFANKSGILGGMNCRCNGTGLDPWVYKMFQKPFEPGKLVHCDSVGSASVIVRRNVVEAMKPPHFMFLYRPSRDILLTEDHYFCWVASLLGYEVWADLDMLCSHFKTIDLAGVNARMIKAFHAGAEFQKAHDESDKFNIVVPTSDDIKKVDDSRSEEKKLDLI
jgi:hypothetical protein